MFHKNKINKNMYRMVGLLRVMENNVFANMFFRLSSSTSDRGGRTSSDSGSEVNGPSERRRERKSSSSSGKNMRTG